MPRAGRTKLQPYIEWGKRGAKRRKMELYGQKDKLSLHPLLHAMKGGCRGSKLVAARVKDQIPIS